MGFIESDKVLTVFLFIYLFIYLYLRCKVCSCPVNQIKIIFLKKKKTNCQFIPELVTCDLVDLTRHNLAYSARLLDCQHPTFLFSMKIPFFSLIWSWVEGLLMLGCNPVSAANRVSHSKISVSNLSYRSLTDP